MKNLVSGLLIISTLFFSFNLVSTPDGEAEKKIRAGLENMFEGWNNADGQQFASMVSEDHDWVVWNGLYNQNLNMERNAEIHQSLFDNHYAGVDIHHKISRIRLLTPNVAVVHVLVATYEEGSIIPEKPELIAVMVMQKLDASWKIQNFQLTKIQYETMIGPEKSNVQEAVMGYSRASYPAWYN